MQRDTLAELVAQDLTVGEIAERLGRSPSTVRHWLKRHDLRTTEAARRRGIRAELPRSAGICPRHGETDHVTRSDGQRICLRCRSDAVRDWRRRTKQRLIDDAGGACVLCGFSEAPAALHFHHLDPDTKRFAIGARGLTRSFAALQAEVAKCILLCANCHACVESGVRELPSAAALDTMLPESRGRG